MTTWGKKRQKRNVVYRQLPQFGIVASVKWWQCIRLEWTGAKQGREDTRELQPENCEEPIMMNAKQMLNSLKRQKAVSFSIYGTGLLLLMLASPLASAKPDCDDPPCKGGNTSSGPAFYMAVVKDDDVVSHKSELYQPSSLDADCLAKAHTNFDAVFGDQSCATVTYTTDSEEPDPTIRYTIGFHVTRDKKSGDIVSVWLQGQGVVEDEVLMHVGGEMYTTDSWVQPSGTDGSFIIHLHADDVIFTRCDAARLIGKTVCDVEVGTFAIDDLWYFPNP